MMLRHTPGAPCCCCFCNALPISSSFGGTILYVGDYSFGSFWASAPFAYGGATILVHDYLYPDQTFDITYAVSVILCSNGLSAYFIHALWGGGNSFFVTSGTLDFSCDPWSAVAVQPTFQLATYFEQAVDGRITFSNFVPVTPTFSQ